MWIELENIIAKREKTEKLLNFFNLIPIDYIMSGLKDISLEIFINKIKKYNLIDILKHYGNNFQINIYYHSKADTFNGYFQSNDDMVKIYFKYDIDESHLYDKTFTLIYDELIKMYGEKDLKQYIKYKG